MAKHRRRRKFRRYIRGNIELNIDIGTLAAKTLAAQVNGSVVEEKTFLSSVVARYNLSQVTPLAGVGPLVFGLAHSDYSAAEIEAFLEQTGSWTEGDKISQEVARRKIKIVGQFEKTDSSAITTVNYNEGKPIRTKLGWVLTTGQTFDLWIYNMGEVAYASTDPDLTMIGHANLFPM